jgi:hypothetical protein
MNDAVELVSDGKGLAVIGEKSAIDRFLDARGLLASSRELDLRRIKPLLLTTAAHATQTAAEIAATSGRWLKLTEESARKVHAEGLMKSKTPGESHLMIGVPGEVKSWLQAEDGVGALLSNPAALSGVASLMSQLAGQQAMAQITDYLVQIDEKLDDVRRSQKAAALAPMDGVALALREARSKRDSVGRVSEVTWSNLAGASTTIFTVQCHAARELENIAKELEKKSRVGGLAKLASSAKAGVELWLAVLARCFQLQDELVDIELDRVLETSPEDLEDHRLGWEVARQDRLELFSEYTAQLLDRMNVAVGKANGKLVWNLSKSMEVIQVGNEIATDVDIFHERIGVEVSPRSWTLRQLGPVAEKGALAIQVTKDGTPYAAGLGVAALALVKKGPRLR